MLLSFYFMRKVCLYWSATQITLLDDQLKRLKTLTSLYPQLLLSQTQPQKPSPQQDYIRLTSSKPGPTNHLNLLATIVYCLKQTAEKTQQIQQNYAEFYKKLKQSYTPKVVVTDDFEEVVAAVLGQLGYEGELMGGRMRTGGPGEGGKVGVDRFQADKERRDEAKIAGEFMLREEFMDINIIRQTAKSFKLDLPNLQSQPIPSLIQTLQSSLQSHLSTLSPTTTCPLSKQFQKISSSTSLLQLCRACLHFYTMQQHHLYQHLNYLLRNVRSVVFRDRLEKLGLFCFLLIMNFGVGYGWGVGDGEDGGGVGGMRDGLSVLYRYTDVVVGVEMVGKIVTVPSFYSVSATQNLPSFSTKQTKIIIHPLLDYQSSISLNSIFPIHHFSAFKNEQEHLYIPFTCFLITQVTYSKADKRWTVVMREVPGNPMIKRIFQINLLDGDQGGKLDKVMMMGKEGKEGKGKEEGKLDKGVGECSGFTGDWELKFSERYQYSKNPIVRIRASINLGLIYMRLIQKLHMAINYFLQAIDLAVHHPKCESPQLLLLLLKSHNYLGLAYLQSQSLQKSQQAFQTCEKYLQQLQSLHKHKNKDCLNFLSAALKNNQALLCEAKEMYQDAFGKYREALLDLGSSEGRSEGMEACILGNLGMCLGRGKGESKEVWGYLRDSLVKYLRLYGIMPSQLIQQTNGQNPQIHLESLLSTILKTPTPIPEVLPLLQNLSQLHESRKNLAQSIACQQQAIKMYQKLNLIAQNESSTFFHMKSRLAALLMKAGRERDGIQMYEGLMAVVRVVDQGRRMEATIAANIAAGYVGLGEDQELEKAVWWYNEAIRIISDPLLSENLQFYNKICDLRKQIQQYLKVVKAVKPKE